MYYERYWCHLFCLCIHQRIKQDYLRRASSTVRCMFDFVIAMRHSGKSHTFVNRHFAIFYGESMDFIGTYQSKTNTCINYDDIK